MSSTEKQETVNQEVEKQEVVNPEVSKEANKDKGKKTVIVILCLLLLILLAVIIYLLWPKEEEKRNRVVTSENVGEILEDIEEEPEPVPAATYTVKMNSEWKFENGTAASSNAYVENSEHNEFDVYFDVLLGEEEEVIYQSPILPVGEHVDNITLTKDLDAGVYDAVVVYHLVDENQETLSTVRVSVKLLVAS